MLTFLAPALLAAAAALAVPLLIHLWSRGEGPRVRVGSVRLLAATDAARARRLRLTRPGLLAVRLALLGVLVLLLAGLALRDVPAPEAPARRALVAPAVDAADPATATRLAALAADGWALHRLAPGLPPFDLDAPPAPQDTTPDAWALLRAADATLPPGSELAVVAPAGLAYARGARPTLAADVRWLPVPGATPDRWIASARRLGDGRVEAVVAADAGGSVARSRVVLGADAPAADLRLDGPAVRLPDGTARPVDAAADSLHVLLVHADDRAEDAAYVRTAVDAAAAHAHRPVALRRAAPGAALPAADLVFWLAPAPPDTLPGLAVVTDEAARRAGSLPWPGAARRIVVPGRLHPAHDAVVLEATFPVWVLDLLDAAGAAAPAEDRRAASVRQLLPRAGGPAAPEEAPTADLRLPLWALALVLFAVERVLAFRP